VCVRCEEDAPKVGFACVFIGISVRVVCVCIRRDDQMSVCAL
jgi:peptide deformylase